MEWKDFEQKFNTELAPKFSYMESEFSKLRTGRATPSILDGIKADDGYGNMKPVKALANIQVSDARTILIKCFDKSGAANTISAINKANIGINPVMDGLTIKLSFPAPTEQGRKDLAKKAKEIGETVKSQIRTVRQSIQKIYQSNKDFQKDDLRYLNEQMDKFTATINKKVEDMVKNKEKEIMTL